MIQAPLQLASPRHLSLHIHMNRISLCSTCDSPHLSITAFAACQWQNQSSHHQISILSTQYLVNYFWIIYSIYKRRISPVWECIHWCMLSIKEAIINLHCCDRLVLYIVVHGHEEMSLTNHIEVNLWFDKWVEPTRISHQIALWKMVWLYQFL